MESRIERAGQLLGRRRHDLAEKELRLALVEDPEDPAARAYLAIVLDGMERGKEALKEAHEAVRLGPDLPFAHYALAVVLHSLDLLREAEAAVRQAIRLAPDDANAFALLASIHLQSKKWAEGQSSAEEGLRIDPEHGACRNLLAQALIKQGKRGESTQAVDAALRQDPEDAHTHANKGWLLLESGDPAKALEHFREALRMDPSIDWARQGIVEALKARYLIYRWMLRYFFWMARQQEKTKWAVIIAILFGRRLLGTISPWLAIPVTLFIYLTWCAVPLFNCLLFLNRYGRLALEKEERFTAARVGLLFGGALSCLIIGLAYRSGWAILSAIYLALLVIPVAAAFGEEKPRPRRILLTLTAILALTGAIGVARACLGMGTMTFDLYFLGVGLFTWAAAFISR